jgi:hypothetical protein
VDDCLVSGVVKSLGNEFGAESKGVKIPAPTGQMLQYAEGVEMLDRIVIGDIMWVSGNVYINQGGQDLI